MIILNLLLLAIIASLITLTVVILAEAGLQLTHVLAKRFKPLTVALTSALGKRPRLNDCV